LSLLGAALLLPAHPARVLASDPAGSVAWDVTYSPSGNVGHNKLWVAGGVLYWRNDNTNGVWTQESLALSDIRCVGLEKIKNMDFVGGKLVEVPGFHWLVDIATQRGKVAHDESDLSHSFTSTSEIYTSLWELNLNNPPPDEATAREMVAFGRSVAPSSALKPEMPEYCHSPK
jgi:hypothetical protein